MGSEVATMLSKVCILLLVLVNVILSERPPTIRYGTRSDPSSGEVPFIKGMHRFALKKRSAEDLVPTVKSEEPPRTVALLPWDLQLYNPMLRGKKNSDGPSCMIRNRFFNHCPLSMVIRGDDNSLYKILYGHA